MLRILSNVSICTLKLTVTYTHISQVPHSMEP